MGNPGWVKAKHLQLEKIKNMKRLLIFIFILSSGMAVKFSFEPELPRQEKSLLNTFPFNKQEDNGEHDHNPHHADQEDYHPHHADQYDDVVQCDHSYDKRCHISYITNYVSQQEVECEENFVKNCFIDYEQIAFNETITVCRNPLVKDCEV